MSKKTFDAYEYMAVVARLNDIDIRDEWKPAVVMHIETAKNMMSVCASMPIDDQSIDLANIFIAK